MRTNQLLNNINTYLWFICFYTRSFYYYGFFLLNFNFFLVLLCNNVVLFFFFFVSYLSIVAVYIVHVHRRKYYLQQSIFFVVFQKKPRIRLNKYQKSNLKVRNQTVCCFFFSIFMCFLFSIDIFSNKYIAHHYLSSIILFEIKFN